MVRIRKYILGCIIALLFATLASAQDSYNERAKKYIVQYYELAISEQRSAGIPAAITLGQGLLETEAGASELMTQANNHFGIKCKNGWTGETFSHDDDAPGECFKKYSCAADSYHDHSLHLKRNPRYAPLFTIPETDYAGWAHGLKKCGYATNPQYAERLISIIETFNLQDYTYSGLDSNFKLSLPEDDDSDEDEPAFMASADTSKLARVAAPVTPAPVPVLRDTAKPVSSAGGTAPTVQTSAYPDPLKDMADSARQVIMAPPPKKDTPAKAPQMAIHQRPDDSRYDSGRITEQNGLKAFYAHKGEMLLQYAVKYKVHYPRLLEMNDLPDAPLPFDTYVYLEHKRGYGVHAKHTVVDGENLLMIAQEEGMQLKRIMALNYLKPGDEPAVGAILELQVMAARKPDTRFGKSVAHRPGSIAAAGDTVIPNDDYISLRDQDTAQKPKGTPQKDYVGYIAGTDYKGNAAGEPNDTAKEDLSSLKAELDKVVYADDSNIPKTSSEPVKNKPEPQSRPAPEKSGSKNYKVKRGDTAFSIARRNNITVRQLLKWNDIDDASDVKVGQTLRVKE